MKLCINDGITHCSMQTLMSVQLVETIVMTWPSATTQWVAINVPALRNTREMDSRETAKVNGRYKLSLVCPDGYFSLT